MDEEFKKKAAEALKAGADAAKKLGGIACDLGKKGFEAAKEKAKDLNEKARAASEKAKAEREEKRRAEAERMADYERKCAEERAELEHQLADANRKESEHADLQRESIARAAKWQGDPEDKMLYLARGWLLALWWFWNVVYTVACLAWLSNKMNARSYYSRGGEWIPIVTLVGLLIWNRIAYEFAIAFFEMVKHLRQVRDELRRHNMREELWLERRSGGGRSEMVEPSGASEPGAAE